MAEQAGQMAFAHTTQFHTSAAERLAHRLLQLAPEGMRRGGRVYFTSGGSEANETAIKLARQFHLERGQPQRFRVVSRRQSYHGSTLGAMAVSGNVARKSPYLPLLPDWGHIAPCFCARCPLNLKFPECDLACAEELETLLRHDAGSIAAFIFEPVVGATLGAVAPAEGYVQRIAEICHRHGILLIADEIMTGMGRTGKNFAVEHWNVEPDIITLGKGIASGYAPLGAVIAGPRVVDAVAGRSGVFQHGFTYQAHPVAMAAGNAVLDCMEKDKLFVRAAHAGRALFAALEPLRAHPHVSDVRGMGLLAGVEFVRDKKTGEPFPAEDKVCELIYQAAMEQEVLTYPTHGCVDGHRGDHILLAPPFVVSQAECAIVARALGASMDHVFTLREGTTKDTKAHKA
jgi:adenosylmethionine-8-amino-7-oxononanoate aminotransferase